MRGRVAQIRKGKRFFLGILLKKGGHIFLERGVADVKEQREARSNRDHQRTNYDERESSGTFGEEKPRGKEIAPGEALLIKEDQSLSKRRGKAPEGKRSYATRLCEKAIVRNRLC